MKIAIPTANKLLCVHFGHCDEFQIFDVADGKITKSEFITPPPHEPGLLPRWIKGLGVDTVLAGGMGSRAQNLFKENGVKIVTGVQETNPEKIVNDFLNNSLKIGDNVCDH